MKIDVIVFESNKNHKVIIDKNDDNDNESRKK